MERCRGVHERWLGVLVTKENTMKNRISTKSLGRLPDSMKLAKRWMCFKITASGAKMPISPVTGTGGSSTNSDHWVSLEDALKFQRLKGEQFGLAFVLGGGFSGLDLDHVTDALGNYTNEDAERIIHNIGDLGYAERSVSGDGIHVIFNTDKPEGYVCKASLEGNAEIEFYGAGRYFTVSLDNESFGDDRDHYTPSDNVVGWICDSYFKKGTRSNQKVTTKPVALER
jgi:hypothetical protein